jgi:hypothetical protein
MKCVVEGEYMSFYPNDDSMRGSMYEFSVVVENNFAEVFLLPDKKQPIPHEFKQREKRNDQRLAVVRANEIIKKFLKTHFYSVGEQR